MVSGQRVDPQQFSWHLASGSQVGITSGAGRVIFGFRLSEGRKGKNPVHFLLRPHRTEDSSGPITSGRSDRPVPLE